MFLTKKYKILFSGLLFALSFLMVSQVALAVYDSAHPAESTGLDVTAGTGYGKLPTGADADLASIIGKIIGAGLAFLGVVFFCLILYAGLSWILSMGKEEKISEAKEMIIASVLGLLVVLGAYAIINLLANIFTEAIPR